MRQTILDFVKQFEYSPKVENSEKLGSYNSFVVVGMGGSGLAADILKAAYPNLNIIIRKDYGLPEGITAGALVVLNSYSGNTEEVLDVLRLVQERNMSAAVISTGGLLLSQAQEKMLPYIQLPAVGIQPRQAIGHDLVALVKIIGQEKISSELKNLTTQIQPERLEEYGKKMAEYLNGQVPIIYSSRANWAVAYNWKIIFNETGKIPAFCNVLPELNHNEMTGFDIKDGTRSLSEKFSFIFIKDSNDNPMVLKRFDVLKKLYEERSLPVTEVSLEGSGRFERIFSSIILASWVAYYLAQAYGVEPEAVPMVEEFKKLIK